MGIESNLLEIAKRDLQTSELILGTSNDEIMQNMAAYHTQQSIEKVIKYLISKSRGFAGIEHDIERLCIEAESVNVNIPEWVLGWQNRSGVPTRPLLTALFCRYSDSKKLSEYCISLF